MNVKFNLHTYKRIMRIFLLTPVSSLWFSLARICLLHLPIWLCRLPPLNYKPYSTEYYEKYDDPKVHKVTL